MTHLDHEKHHLPAYKDEDGVPLFQPSLLARDDVRARMTRHVDARRPGEDILHHSEPQARSHDDRYAHDPSFAIALIVSTSA